MNYQQLRKEAEAEAKKILKDKTKFGPTEFEGREKITKKFQSGKHAYLKQSEIDHCINNGMNIWYLYDEMDAKYKGGVTEKKQYYIPRGTPKGRPKKNTNEQEQ
jgi:hypothetical protein